VLNSPKGQTTPLPPDLVQRPVVEPELAWPWFLVWRADEIRPAVLAAVEAISANVCDVGLSEGIWVPKDNPA
jgi:hypothetical protein